MIWRTHLVLPLLGGLLFCLQQQPNAVVNAQAIQVSRSCVPPGQNFAITFQNVNPSPDDWIGIVHVSENLSAFSSLADWMWTCGSKSCGDASAGGQVFMSSVNIPESDWFAVLARGNDAAPWSAYAISNQFTVSSGCTPPLSTDNAAAFARIQAARQEIANIISADIKMAPQFLRMAFHDCIGGCDGCVDLDDPSNAGIGPAIDALQPIVDRHAFDGVSRADLWALSAVVGAELAQRQNFDRVPFPLRFWGRVDCENTGAACVDANGVAVACSAKKGSFHVFPDIHMHTSELYGFFASNFGFNQRETVTIMGAHTLGVIRPEDFGINGLNGWKLNKDVLDIGYYEELVGGTSPLDPVEVLVNQAPPWQLTSENDKHFWIGFPNGVRVVMLNSDIALVRQLDDTNMNKATGQVSCSFEDDMASPPSFPVCPHVEGALQIAAEFFHDNRGWIMEFEQVLGKMLTNGYNRVDCNEDLCKLSR